MTWTIRLRLAATLLVTLVVVAALVVIFNQRQHTIASTSATIVAPSVTVASNYDGTVIRSYVDVGSDVTKGEKLFEVSSVSLQQDLANDVKIADSDALRVDEETGTLTYLATTDGTVTQIEVEPGQKVAEGDIVAIIESMKMEIPVITEKDGVVSGLPVAKAAAVVEGQTIVILEV